MESRADVNEEAAERSDNSDVFPTVLKVASALEVLSLAKAASDRRLLCWFNERVWWWCEPGSDSVLEAPKPEA